MAMFHNETFCTLCDSFCLLATVNKMLMANLSSFPVFPEHPHHGKASLSALLQSKVVAHDPL